MEPKNTQPLARHVQPDLSQARIGRLWAGVATRLEARPRGASRWLWKGAAVLSVAAAATGAALLVPALLELEKPSSHWKSTSLETAGDRLSFALEDGSTIRLAAHSRVDLAESQPSGVKLKLRRGRIACDVSHQPGRAFSVLARDVEVRVVGTRFEVALDTHEGRDQVSVHVERGIVEVRTTSRPDEVRRLHAGERWFQLGQPRSAPSAAMPELPPPSSPAPAVPNEPRDNPSRPPPQQVVETATARQLLDTANAARRDGDVQKAAAAYESLVRLHPSDGRAALAAFELGRLRMDRLGDLKGAVQALNRAIQLAPTSAFREDALARLSQAYDGLGALDRCRQAQATYLASYPGGVHATSVKKRCSR